MGSQENNWIVSLRMNSVDEDEADPFEDFFFNDGLEALGVVREGAICEGLQKLEE